MTLDLTTIEDPELKSKLDALLQGEKLGGIELDDECKIEVEYSGDEECIGAIKEHLNILEKIRKAEERAEKEAEGLRDEIRRLLDRAKEAGERVERTCGRSLYEIIVAGYYTCEDKRITLHLGCYKLLETWRTQTGALRYMARVLGHELVHHL